MTDEIRIEIADQDKVDFFEKQIDIVLKALGHPEALVTDESMVTDFMSHFGSFQDASNLPKMQALEFLMGRTVKYNEYIWQLANELSKKDEKIK